MKKLILTAFIILVLYLNVFSASDYSFDVKVSGNRINNVLLIPGWSCGGDVWKETVSQLVKTTSAMFLL